MAESHASALRTWRTLTDADRSHLIDSLDEDARVNLIEPVDEDGPEQALLAAIEAA